MNHQDWLRLPQEEKKKWYVSPNFHALEFVPIEIFDEYDGDLEPLLKLIDPKIIKVAQEIRNILKLPMTINNKFKGGSWNYRGLRTSACKEYRKGSMHSCGKAIDFSVEGKDSMWIFNTITNSVNWPKLEKLGATRVESFVYTPGWLHIDCKIVKGIKLPVIVTP